MTMLETRTVCLQCVDTHNAISPFSTRISGAIDFEITSHTVYGDESGPSLYVGGCMHGDELNGLRQLCNYYRLFSPKISEVLSCLYPFRVPLRLTSGKDLILLIQ